jgi:hypothetical protein
MKSAKIILLLCLLLSLLLSITSFAATIPVDLNDFYADYTVSVAADGQSAIMAEDEAAYTVYLANDPIYGDPGIVVSENVLSLGFHLNFVEEINNNDTFLATLFDGDTGTIIDDFYLEDSWEGDVFWDLSFLNPAMNLLGLEFQLNAWDGYFASTATISNLAFVTEDIIEDNGPAPVPEPSTVLLLGAGLAGLVIVRKKQRK